MKTKKYYVVYERYTEYNQFEGIWEQHYDGFNSLDKCEKDIKGMKENKYGDYKNIIGPLIVAKQGL